VDPVTGIAALKRGTAALSASALYELAVGDQPPTEFRIFGKGDNTSEKGTFVFDDVAAEMVMSKWAERGVPMGFDYEHQSVQEPPIVAPAAGWFTPQVRDGELWATDIRWTPKAADHLVSKEYRLFSPAFGFEEMPDGRMRVTKLINVALTNNPALHNIEPLVAAKDKHMDEEEAKQLRADLAASREECKRLVAQLKERDEEMRKLKSKSDHDEDDMKATAALRDEVKTVTGKGDAADQIGTLRALKQRADAGDTAVAKLREIEQKGRNTEFTTLLDGAFKDGKISPAQRKDYWEKLYVSDGNVSDVGVAHLKAWLPTANVQVNLKETALREGGGQVFSKDEEKVMERMGITTPEQREKFQKMRLGAAG
jgi:phage I-like protein